MQLPTTKHKIKNPEVFTSGEAIVRLHKAGASYTATQFYRAVEDAEAHDEIAPMRLPNGTRLFQPQHLPPIRARLEARAKIAGRIAPSLPSPTAC